MVERPTINLKTITPIIDVLEDFIAKSVQLMLQRIFSLRPFLDFNHGVDDSSYALRLEFRTSHVSRMITEKYAQSLSTLLDNR